MNSDRIPPACPEIEKTILASMLYDKKTFLKYAIQIKSEWFFAKDRQKIFETMIKLNTVDTSIIAESLPGIWQALGEISENIGANVAIDEEISILRDRFERREIIKYAESAITAAYEDYDQSPIEIIQNAASKISDNSNHYSAPKKIIEVIPKIFERMEQAKNRAVGLQTGVSDIDYLIDGFVEDDFIILAGRPSMGKTALALQIARYNAIQKKNPILIFSIETGCLTMSARILFSEAGVRFDQAFNGTLPLREYPALSNSSGPCSEADIYIDETAAIPIGQIEAVSEIYSKNHGIKLIIVDHIGLVKTDPGRSRHEEVSSISKRLKALQKRLKTPLIALSQLSRKVDERNPPIPMLSDLRESGSLEEDSDKVIFLYREEYYKRQSEKKNIAQVIVAKYKNGKTGYKEVYFDKEKMNFKNLENNRTDFNYEDRTNI